MKKRIIISALIFLIILSVAVFVFLNTSKIRQVCIKEKCFNVEIADSQEEQELGLMNRPSLDLNSGMLFVFDKSDYYGFWMKNTLIPLDVLWISEDKTIVGIERNAQPCLEEKCPTAIPYEKAIYVLEINAGLSEELGIKKGDKVSFRK